MKTIRNNALRCIVATAAGSILGIMIWFSMFFIPFFSNHESWLPWAVASLFTWPIPIAISLRLYSKMDPLRHRGGVPIARKVPSEG